MLKNTKFYFTDVNNNTYERFVQYFERINSLKEFNLEFVALCNNAVFPGYKHRSKRQFAYSWYINISPFPPPHPTPNFRSQYDSKIFSSCFAVPVFNSVADVQTHDTSHPPPSKLAFTSPRAALSSFRHLARTKAHSWYGIRTSSTSQWCSYSASFP
jgi:hypothetical protein